MFERIKNIKEKFSELERQIRSTSEGVLKETFAELFVKYPDLEEIRWQQYTPYFNDGDPCVFRVYELAYTYSGQTVESWEKDPETAPADFVTDINSLSRLLVDDSLEPVLKAGFGDDSEIVVTKNKIEVRDYSGSHD